MDRSKFCKQVLKRVTQGTFLWNYLKTGQAVQEEKIFKELLKKFHFIAMATRVFDRIKFCEQLLKRSSQGKFLPSFVQIGQAVWEKTFKGIVDDGSTQDYPNPLQHVVLSWGTCLFNPFPSKPWFLLVCSRSLMKTLWEKEKLLETSNFSFSHSVFYPLGELSAIFTKLRIVVCKLFEFGIV